MMALTWLGQKLKQLRGFLSNTPATPENPAPETAAMSELVNTSEQTTSEDDPPDPEALRRILEEE